MTGLLPARNAVATVFVLNGFIFATLFSRIPDLRSGLALSNSGLGLLLLGGASGSMVALPSAGLLIRRTSAAAVVRAGGVATALALPLAAVGAQVMGSALLAGIALFCYGMGTAVWDVAMNVEGATVEQGLGRSVMPRFHAAFSLGSVVGAGAAVVMTAADVPLLGHYGAAGATALGVLWATRAFLPAEPEVHQGSVGSAWREPRTLAIGAIVLAFALTEGAANDWLALGLIDGYGAPRWVGVAGFATFVLAMTAGRMVGTLVLDRYGRVPVLRATAILALAGVLLLVLGSHPILVGLGVVAWVSAPRSGSRSA